MVFKKISVLLVSFCLLVGCADERGEVSMASKFADDSSVKEILEHLSTRRVAVVTGSAYENSLQKEYPEMQVMRMGAEADMLQALISNRCDAAIFDGHILAFHAHSLKSLKIFDDPYCSADIGAAFNKDNMRLKDQFNEFLKKIKADGTYDQMHERWIINGNESEMPEIEVVNSGTPLRVSILSSSPPMSFLKNGRMAGMEIELAMRFANYIGRPVEFIDMNFPSMIPSIVSGSSDIILSSMFITEERAKSVNFSDPYFTADSQVVIYNESLDTSGNIFEELKGAIYRNLIEEDRYKLILDGFKTTAWISLLSILLGTILGGVVCWMNMCRYKVLNLLARVYINTMRGIPLLVLLMLMFYVVFAGTGISAVFVSVITFAVNFSAYVSEIFRSSIESVDCGQTEAGISLGFNKLQTFIYIIVPQAFKQALPVFKGEMISLVKMTSIAGFIAVQDLTKVGDIVRSRTFDAFFPLVVVAILYFLLAWLFSKALDIIANRTIKK